MKSKSMRKQRLSCAQAKKIPRAVVVSKDVAHEGVLRVVHHAALRAG